MTRDEAIELFGTGNKSRDVWLINKIYDSLEDRTCESCKFYDYKEGSQPDGMLWIKETCDIYSDVVPELIERDGCNKYQPKD